MRQTVEVTGIYWDNYCAGEAGEIVANVRMRWEENGGKNPLEDSKRSRQANSESIVSER